MITKTEHFKLSEFNCHCGCGENRTTVDLLILLEVLRAEVKKPILIISGTRCKKHNSDVGGKEKSQHMEGTAADIKVIGIAPDLLAGVVERLHHNGAIRVGGIGIYATFLHVDVREGTARWKG